MEVLLLIANIQSSKVSSKFIVVVAETKSRAGAC